MKFILYSFILYYILYSIRYRPHPVHDASQNYVPFSLMRELRSGAEDEVIDLPVPKLQLGDNEAAVGQPEVRAPEPVATKVRIEWFFARAPLKLFVIRWFKTR